MDYCAQGILLSKHWPHLPVWNHFVSKMCIKILGGINYRNRDGAGHKHKQWHSVGGRYLHKKISPQNLIRGIHLLSQIIQRFQKANLTYATNQWWGNSYSYKPWAVVTTQIHKVTEQSRHFKLPKALQILSDNTDRSYCTYTALHLWTATTVSSQLGEVTTSGSHLTADCDVLLWGLVATLIKGFFFLFSLNTQATGR